MRSAPRRPSDGYSQSIADSGVRWQRRGARLRPLISEKANAISAGAGEQLSSGGVLMSFAFWIPGAVQPATTTCLREFSTIMGCALLLLRNAWSLPHVAWISEPFLNLPIGRW